MNKWRRKEKETAFVCHQNLFKDFVFWAAEVPRAWGSESEQWHRMGGLVSSTSPTKDSHLLLLYMQPAERGSDGLEMVAGCFNRKLHQFQLQHNLQPWTKSERDSGCKVQQINKCSIFCLISQRRWFTASISPPSTTLLPDRCVTACAHRGRHEEMRRKNKSLFNLSLEAVLWL